MRHIVFSIFFSLAFGTLAFAQDEEKKSTCPEPEEKKAVELYKKGTDKKKYKKPERLKFLEEALTIDPHYAEAAMALGNEIIVKCKLDNLPFATARPYFLVAVNA